MKKLLALAFVMCSLGIANAQIVRSTTFNKVPKEKNKTTWYVRAGVSLNNMTGEGRSNIMKEIKEEELENGVKAGFTTRAGYDFEIGFKKNFGKSDIYWGMELGFGTRGGGFAYSRTLEYEYGEKIDVKETSNLDLYTFKYTPFQIGYMYPINEDFSIDAHLGVFLSTDLGGSMKDKIIHGEKEYEEKYNYKETDCVPFDAGIQLGIGAWYKKFNLDVSWQRGFVKMVGDFPYNEDNYGDIKSSNFVIALGYAF